LESWGCGLRVNHLLLSDQTRFWDAARVRAGDARINWGR
jgi:hypothetical protein